MARAAKKELKIKQGDVVADGGYVKSQGIKDCQDLGMKPRLPAVQKNTSQRAGLYGKEAGFNTPLTICRRPDDTPNASLSIFESV